MKKLIIVALIAISFPVLAQNPASFSKLTCPDISIPAGSTTTALHLRNIGGHLFWGTQRIDTIPDAFAGNETDPVWVHDSADYLKKAGAFYVCDSNASTRTTLEAGNEMFMAKVYDIPNDFNGGIIVEKQFGTALFNDSSYVGFITGMNAESHFIGINNSVGSGRVCLGSSYNPFDTTYSIAANIGSTGYVGFKNRVNPAWWREGLDFGRVDGLSLFSQHGVSATDLAGIDLTSDAIDFSYGDGGAYTTLRYKNLWAGYDLPELGKSSIHTITLAPWSSNGILGDPDSEKWWDWIYSRNLTINDSVYLNNLNTGTSSDSIIVGEAKTNFGSVFTNGRTGKTTLLKKVKNTLSNGVTAYNWGNHATMGYLTGISAASYTITVTSAGNCTGNAATVTNGLYTTDRITTTGTSTTKVMTQKAVKDYGDSIANVKSAKADTGANKKNAAYFDMMVKLALKWNLTDTGAVKKLAAYYWTIQQLAGKAATNQTMYLGTTSVAINRGSGALSLAGVNIDGTAGNISLAATAGKSLRYISGAWRAWPDSLGSGTVDTTTAGTGLVNKTRMSHLSSYPTLNQNTTGTAGNISLAGSAGQSLRYISGAWRAWADSIGGAGTHTIDSVWHTPAAIAYASASTFTYTGGTDVNAKMVKWSLCRAVTSNGATLKVGYISAAVNSSGTVTCTWTGSADLASGDIIKIAVNQKVNTFERYITVPGEAIADTGSQGMYFNTLRDTTFLLPVDFSARKAAAGTGASCTFNIRANYSTLFSSAPDLSTNKTSLTNRPTTFLITPGKEIDLIIGASAGASSKAQSVQARLILVPTSLFRCP